MLMGVDLLINDVEKDLKLKEKANEVSKKIKVEMSEELTEDEITEEELLEDELKEDELEEE